MLHTAQCFPSNSATVIPISKNFCHIQDRPLNFLMHKFWKYLMHRAWRNSCTKSGDPFIGCCTWLSHILSHSDQRYLLRYCWLPLFHSCLTTILDVNEQYTRLIGSPFFSTSIYSWSSQCWCWGCHAIVTHFPGFSNHLTILSFELVFTIEIVLDCTPRYVLSLEQMPVTQVLLWT